MNIGIKTETKIKKEKIGQVGENEERVGGEEEGRKGRKREEEEGGNRVKGRRQGSKGKHGGKNKGFGEQMVGVKLFLYGALDTIPSFGKGFFCELKN